MTEPKVSPEVLKKNRQLGRVLSILAIVLAVGTYIALGVTHFNPFDKPPISQSGGM